MSLSSFEDTPRTNVLFMSKTPRSTAKNDPRINSARVVSAEPGYMPLVQLYSN